MPTIKLEPQKTIAQEASLRGIGVHTGVETTVVVKPAPVDQGILFIRTDLPGRPEIPAEVSAVTDTGRGTTLGVNGGEVRTVEHLLAALAGLGIDNAVVEMDGPELPMGDGSSLPFIRMILAAGIRELSRPRSFYSLTEPVYLVEADGIMVALPADDLRIACTIAFGRPQLDSQYLSLTITPTIFERDLAPARTFGFYRDALPLMERGLIRGTSLDNTVVIGEDAIFSSDGLRFTDECVRHKILDLVGDLSLVGRPLRALIIAIKPGHRLNIEFIGKMKEALHESGESC